MSVIGSGMGNAANLLASDKTSGLTPGKSNPGEKAKEEFLAYVSKTPAERMRDTALKQMGLTEESLAAMDEKTREKIEQKIREMIEEKIKKAVGKTTGDLPSGTFASFVA